MDTVAPRHCDACGCAIWHRQAYWEFHCWPRVGPRTYCEECVMQTAPVVHPDAPLLPPKGWGPEPMGSAKRRRKTGVQAERSEP